MAEQVATSTSAAAAPAVPFFKKKSKASSSNAQARRKRSISPAAASEQRSKTNDRDNADADAAGPSVVRLAKKEMYNPLKQGTSNKRRKGNDDEDDDDDSYALNDGTSKVSVSYKDRTSRRRSASPAEDGKEMVLSGDAALSKSGEAPAPDGLYHGQSAYQAQLPTGSSKFGPIKGPSANIRTITLVDYQPDVCKDYKETGWCGFGDSCKFLHDRGDYLHGWQLDNAYLSDRPAADARAVEEVVEEELPFACLICREPFGDPPHNPVVTRCGHYFGSSCAINRFKKTAKCYACGAGTGGIFNTATRILERKEKAQKERIRQREELEGKDDYEQGGDFEIEGLAEG